MEEGAPGAAKQYKRTYRETHAEQVNAAKRRLYGENRERERENQRRRREQNPDRFAEYAQKQRSKRREEGLDTYYKHGLTSEDRESLNSRQNDACGICKRPLAELSRVCVDHDHRTNGIRGLLCQSCNVKLGHREKFAELVEPYLALPQITPAPATSRGRNFTPRSGAEPRSVT